MDFHPYAASYPMLAGAEYEAFRADIAAGDGPKQPVIYRLVNGQKQYLDGRNRLRACADLQLTCPEQLVRVADDGVEAFIDSLNLHRRHLTPEQVRAKRQARVGRVAEKRSEGKSLRTIADEEGVSKTQVIEDLEKATGQGVSSEPKDGKIKGKDDGRQQPATKPPVPILCDRCKRVGAAFGCKSCKALRDGKAASEPAKAPSSPKSGSKVKFDDSKFEQLYGPLVRFIDARAVALGTGKHHKRCLELLGQLVDEYIAWKKTS